MATPLTGGHVQMTGASLSFMASAPWTLHRFTRDEYAMLIDLNIKCELIDGEIIDVSPMRHRHAFVVAKLLRLVSNASPATVFVSGQTPIILDDYSEPEPDVWASLLSESVLATRKPNGNELTLLVEVSETTYVFDRNRKLPAYAAASVPVVWLVDLTRNVVEVHTQPSGPVYSQPSGPVYSQLTTLSINDELTLPWGPTLSIAEFLTPS
jgi:Putative restriction endonuclease